MGGQCGRVQFFRFRPFSQSRRREGAILEIEGETTTVVGKTGTVVDRFPSPFRTLFSSRFTIQTFLLAAPTGMLANLSMRLVFAH